MPPDTLRQDVAETLRNAPSFQELPPERRSRLARDMSEVVSRLAVYGAPRAEAMAETVSATDHLANREKDVDANMGRNAAESMGRMMQAVDFPDFVASLIKGVFQAIVDASIQQMEAYQELLEAAVGATSKFLNEIPDEEASSFLTSSFPGVFAMGGTGGMGGMSMPGMEGAGGMGGMDGGKRQTLQLAEGAQMPDLSAYGLPAGFELEGPEAERTLINSIKLKIASQKQQLLATMVLLGINRIIVTDGKINAKVKITVEAQEKRASMGMEQASGDVNQITHDRSRSYSSAHHSELSGVRGRRDYDRGRRSSYYSSSHRDKEITTKVGTSTGAQQSSRNQSLDINAELMGEVSINFRSETFPLEKMMPPTQIDMLQRNAEPAAKASIDAEKKAQEGGAAG